MNQEFEPCTAHHFEFLTSLVRAVFPLSIFLIISEFKRSNSHAFHVSGGQVMTRPEQILCAYLCACDLAFPEERQLEHGIGHW